MVRTKTIGEHFEHHSEYGIDIEDITMGLFDEEMDKGSDVTDLDLLVDLCNDVALEWGAYPYLGSKTHGNIMLEAMQRFTTKTGRKVPPCWYPIARTLWERHEGVVA